MAANPVPEKPGKEQTHQVSPPSISLPKGGGAIRGIGEKFAANPVTGTGSMTVPIATSPGRSGFGPQLSLSYDSGAGNGPFGFGWSLSLPAITRKTEKGLPQYRDAEESDVFILSGAEDLVPVLVEKNGQWEREQLPRRKVAGKHYRIQRYRPRIEGLFARIERWTNQADDKDTFWRSISKDNITTWYGKTENSRIFDPAARANIFSWLICQSYDDKGNVIIYRYKEEDSGNVDLTQASERNRTRNANRYLKKIYYGNREPYLPVLTDIQWPQPPDSNPGSGPPNYYFEVVFDYDDGHYTEAAPDAEGRVYAQPVCSPPTSAKWSTRVDPFSSYRAGFEVRTYRLCQRVLMFHHFPVELGTPDCLVWSTDFTYSYENNPKDARNPIYSFLDSVSQSGYLRQENRYLKRSLPPIEFGYTKPEVQDGVELVDPASLDNLPIGLDGSAYRWTDLHGEGIPGILTEQAGAWYYKRNWSPIPTKLPDGSKVVKAKFDLLETVALKPNLALGSGAEFMDLAGDGQPDVVVLEGPTPGVYEHDEAEGWQPFRPFTSRLNRNTRDPNLKFIDLDGDGHADVLIIEDDALVWHASLAEEGFGPAQRVARALDEEKGPRIVFADGTQSIYLADLSGDGLTDIVRVRNGEVCYWPNLGYGRFGAKITMDNAPWFDRPDQFDHKRIRLADIDGSGTTDIIYLHRDGVRLFFNQSGNSWSQPHQLKVFPRVDDVVNIVPIDLLGNGTACLVWSLPLAGDARQPMRYLNLMGGTKPHLLVKTVNNLGAETQVTYASSTKFYLQDKYDGKPWITRLPFPVHVVEKVTITDKWRGTSFATSYTYHHGYFDGEEREFRGFGRVEQLDCESYGKFEKGNSASPYITEDKTLFQPPVKTVTWYHTGASLEKTRIFSHFEHEYFPHWFEELRPDEVNVMGTFQENILPEPDFDDENFSPAEWREALRACKGMMLRQEVYELDVEALEQNQHRPVKLFSTAYHNCNIRRLQPQAFNPHAVFLAAESEAITYHYELDLTQNTLQPDPRIMHTLNVKLDKFANVLQSVSVVYPRLGQDEDDTLPAEALALIKQVQQESHLAYTETRYTNDIEEADNHRLPLPCEVRTYELTSISPEEAGDRLSPDARDNLYFTLEELRRFQLSLVYQPDPDHELISVSEIAYHELPKRTSPEKRLVEHVRNLFFKDNPADAEALQAPLDFGRMGRLGLPYETYKLALTQDLLGAIFENKLTAGIQAQLSKSVISGYLSGADLIARFKSIPPAELSGQYWIPSGIAGFVPDAAQHFYLPERYTDPFGNVTTLEYDPRDLFMASSTDELGNITRVTKFDFRVLAPAVMQDLNDNLSEVLFDVLGLPVVMALKGKGHEGDNLIGFSDTLANPPLTDLVTFFNTPDLNEVQARNWLANATARHVYYFGEVIHNGKTTWAAHPACACGLLREQHAASGDQSPLQAAFEYSNGMGTVLVKKIQAEPETRGRPLRWVANGKIVLNNKAKPVKQYEPYFSPDSVGHCFEEPSEEGVTPVIYYDAVGRTVRTEMPDGSYSRVEFSPWHVRTFDQNDTVKETGNAWLANKTAATASAEEKRAAQMAADHANTPALTILDSLGREAISIAHNCVRDASGVMQYEKYLTFTKLDAEGKPLWIRDARKNLVMQYIRPPVASNQSGDPTAPYVPCYDIAGNLLFQHSMDAGDRWTLNDAAGKAMFSWDSLGRMFRTDYDKLHRPTGSFVKGADPQDIDRVFQFEKIIYGDTPANGLADAKLLNLRGKPYKRSDGAGIIINLDRNPAVNKDEAFDFKGNLLRSTRQLIGKYKKIPDWSQNLELEAEIFSSSITYDALNRPVTQIAPHTPAMKPCVMRLGYNEANLLERVDANLRNEKESNGELKWTPFVTNIDYNAKGQRVLIQYGNRAQTIYKYDPNTFRLVRLRTIRGNKESGDCTPLIDPRTCEDPPHVCQGLQANACILQDFNYVYDPVGNITSIRNNAQQIIYFRKKRVEPSNEYIYDALYRLIEATGREHLGQTGVQLNSPTPPDAFNSLHTRLDHPGDGKVMGRYIEQYLYDAVGNILSMRHAGTGLAKSGWQRCYQYALDSNRLLSTGNPSDPHNPNDPCPTQYAAAPVYAEKYIYDAHGNMITMPHLTLMQWNFKDQLSATARQVVSETSPPDKVPETTYYVYDAAGQRVRKITERQNGTCKEDRIYLGGFEIYRTYNANGIDIKLERETLHIMDDKQRITLVETQTIKDSAFNLQPSTLLRYQFGNHLGSACLELDEQARIISYEEYAPYGSSTYQAVRSQTETAKRYRYTGKERDEESGLYYHGARYFAPCIGRWTATDPIGIGDGSNLYSYVRGRPVGRVDPTGTQSGDVTAAAAGAIERLDQPGNPFQLHGKSGLQRSPVAMDIDEPQPVGEKGITKAEARARALDVNNRTFHDQPTNRKTKYLGQESRPTSAPKEPLSVVDNPKILMDRRFSEVAEMREIFKEAVRRIKNPEKLSPTKLKEAINANVWDIIKTGKSEAAVRVRGALEALGYENIKGKGYVMRTIEATVSEAKPATAAPRESVPKVQPRTVGGAISTGLGVAAVSYAAYDISSKTEQTYREQGTAMAAAQAGKTTSKHAIGFLWAAAGGALALTLFTGGLASPLLAAAGGALLATGGIYATEGVIDSATPQLR